MTRLQPGDEMADLDRGRGRGPHPVGGGRPDACRLDPARLGPLPRGPAAGVPGHRAACGRRHRRAPRRPLWAADPLRAETEEALARRFVADITAGAAPAGVIKIGASYHRLQPLEKKAFAAAARAHQETGVPICVHTEHGTMGLGIVEHLAGLGVPPSSVVLAHLDRNPDPGEHAETAATGAWLQLDGPGRTKYWPDSTILRLISDLADSGLSAQLLLGGDTGRSSTMRSYGGGPGLDYLFARFKPRPRTRAGHRAIPAHLRGQPRPGLRLRASSRRPPLPCRLSRLVQPGLWRLQPARRSSSSSRSGP